VGFAALHLFAARQERKVFMQKLSFKVPIGLIAAAIAGVMSFGSAAQAATILTPSVKLSTLLQGGSVTVGDKVFSNFSYNPTGDMPAASTIDVTGILSNLNNLGIRFSGGFTDLIGGGSSDALIGYRVTVTDPGMRITDAHLDSNLDSGGSVGSGKITETFSPFIPNSPLLGSFNTNFTANNNTSLQIHDDYVWGPPLGYISLDVTKDILLTTTSGTSVTLSFVDQTFSQTPVVPLPAAAWAGFSMLGGLGFFGAVRRRRMA